MRHALPVLRDDALTLKQRRHHQPNGRRQSRLQRRDLLAR